MLNHLSQQCWPLLGRREDKDKILNRFPSTSGFRRPRRLLRLAPTIAEYDLGHHNKKCELSPPSVAPKVLSYLYFTSYAPGFFPLLNDWDPAGD